MMLMKFVMIMAPVLMSVAFMTLAERKLLGLIGLRQGPNKASIQGIFQPMADAIKLSNKSTNNLSNFSFTMYYFSVAIMMFCTIMAWSTINAMETTISWKMSILVLMLILGVSSMKAIMAGWSTYGKYSLVGSMRTVSQMVSYESVIYLCLLSIMWIISSLSIKEISVKQMFMMSLFLPAVLAFWVPSMLAELNRSPYDFSEGESELVSGFNTEFGSSSFTLIFLSEYSNIIFFLSFSTMMMFSMNSMIGMSMIFMMMNYWVVWIRSAVPRLRFDKFMENAWKFYIPFMTMMAIVIISMI